MQNIKQTLNTNKLYRHRENLPKKSQNVSGCGRQFDMEEIPALFDNHYVRAFKQLH